MSPIPAPEFAIMQERRIKALEQYAYRCRNTLKWIGQSTTDHEIRTRAYSTLETEPSQSDAVEKS